MPMMPMEPANAVSRVRVFLVSRLLKLSARAVSGDMEERPRFFVHRRHLSGIIRRKRCGVRLDHAVPQADDAGSILLCKLRVMSDHDHKAVFGHLLQQLHHLNAGVAVQCAGRLVGQQDVGVVDQCAGNGPQRCIWPPDISLGCLCSWSPDLPAPAPWWPGCALGTGNARDGQRQLHIGKHCLVRDEVIALEHKANGGTHRPNRSRPGADAPSARQARR